MYFHLDLQEFKNQRCPYLGRNSRTHALGLLPIEKMKLAMTVPWYAYCTKVLMTLMPLMPKDASSREDVRIMKNLLHESQPVAPVAPRTWNVSHPVVRESIAAERSQSQIQQFTFKPTHPNHEKSRFRKLYIAYEGDVQERLRGANLRVHSPGRSMPSSSRTNAACRGFA